MGALKGKTALQLFLKFSYLKKPYWGNHFLGKGLFVDAVGLDAAVVHKHVMYQDKQDKKN